MNKAIIICATALLGFAAFAQERQGMGRRMMENPDANMVVAECKDGACPLPAAGGEATYTVLSPVPESAVEPIKPAPRLNSLDGKTIALVGGSFMANVTHPELKRLILAEYPTAKVYVLSEIGSAGPYPRPGVVRREKDEFQRKLKEFKIDAVVSGNGN